MNELQRGATIPRTAALSLLLLRLPQGVKISIEEDALNLSVIGIDRDGNAIEVSAAFFVTDDPVTDDPSE